MVPNNLSGLKCEPQARLKPVFYFIKNHQDIKQFDLLLSCFY